MSESFAMRFLLISGLALILTCLSPARGDDGPRKRGKTISSDIEAHLASADKKSRMKGMAVIPAGSFVMGTNSSIRRPMSRKAISYLEGPPVEVHVSRFLIDRYEMTWSEVSRALQVAFENGKLEVSPTRIRNREGTPKDLIDPELLRSGRGFPFMFRDGGFLYEVDRGRHPCGGFTWYGAQAIANYCSDLDDRERCIDFSTWECDFTKNGYRLPTEAEWEKAARGGLKGKLYPWGDRIDGSMGNYHKSGDPYEKGDASDRTTPVGYYDGKQIPKGRDMANGYGLYDMAGNVWEWCYDAYGPHWYSSISHGTKDPKGPPVRYHMIEGRRMTSRVLRSCSFLSSPIDARCTCRCGTRDFKGSILIGFRLVTIGE